jgi:hypothetical protein
MWPLLLLPFTVQFISIKPVLSDNLSHMTIFHCSLGRTICLIWPYFTVPLEGQSVSYDHISLFPWKDNLSHITIFHCSLGSTICLIWPYFTVPLEEQSVAYDLISLPLEEQSVSYDLISLFPWKNNLSHMTLFHCSLGRSHKTGSTVFLFSLGLY